MRIPKINNKELEKWCKILGTYRIKELYMTNKIQLTPEQINRLIELGKEEEHAGEKKRDN